jgi:hypothetical protein
MSRVGTVNGNGLSGPLTLQRLAAVHDNRLSGDPARQITGQEKSEVRLSG